MVKRVTKNKGTATTTVEKEARGIIEPVRPAEVEEVGGTMLEAAGAQAHVEVSLGFTVSAGPDFEFTRGHVTLTMPCDPDIVDEMYEWSKEWVDDRVAALLVEINGDNVMATSDEPDGDADFVPE